MIDPRLLSNYNYNFDESLIASSPANPKDSAKLLIYDRKKDTITHDIFRNVIDYIPKNTKILLNDTKVIKARLYGQKTSGGKIEVLINAPSNNNRFQVYIKGKVKVGTKLIFDKGLSANIISIFDDGIREIEFVQNSNICDIHTMYDILDDIAHIPLPPYIKREDSKDDEIDYQTLFAKNRGAVAAPTASLHFTDELFDSLNEKFDVNYLTLHVGAGTFKSVDTQNIDEYKIHKEIFHIPKKSQDIINSKEKILAIGTTVTRTIEYFYDTQISSGQADIFLHPLNLPKRVDYLITNFHLPKTTLLMLVASFLSIGERDGVKKAIEIYELAVKKRYSFFSYGDAMMIL